MIITSQISRDRNDDIYTPDWVAKDMVEFFQPYGKILEPCRGDGAIYKYLPEGSEWAEIKEGRDFFFYWNIVDWIITNPPFSNIRGFFQHSMLISDNIVFLIPLWKAFMAEGFFDEIDCWGGSIKHIRRYGTGAKLGFPMGNAICAVYLSKGQFDTSWSKYQKTLIEGVN